MRTRSVRPSPDMSARKIDLRAVGEDDAGPFLFVERLGGRGSAGPKPSSASDGYQVKTLVLGDQDVGVAVAVEIDERRFGSLHIEVGQGGKRRERLPSRRPRCARKKPAAGGPAQTKSSWPSPARSRN